METCRHCTARPVAPGRTVCPSCLDEAATHLGHIRDLYPELDSHRARERAIVYTGVGGSPSGETPLPYDPRVTPTQRLCRRAVVDAAAAVRCDHDNPGDDYDPTSIQQTAAWLRGHLEWFGAHDNGPDTVRHIIEAGTAIVALFDRKPDQLYLGPCRAPLIAPDGSDTTCGEELFVEAKRLHDDDTDSPRIPTAAQATCRHCAAVHDVAERREWLKAGLSGHLATVTEAARLLGGLVGISRHQINRLAAAKRITAHGMVTERTSSGASRTALVYALGEVIEAYEKQQSERKAAKQ